MDICCAGCRLCAYRCIYIVLWPHIGVLPGCDVSEVLFSNTIVRLRYTWSDNQSREGGFCGSSKLWYIIDSGIC